MSVVAAPLAGRGSTTGFPAREQVFVPTEKTPRAAIFRSKSSPGKEIPAVVGSTTTMSILLASGASFVRAMLPSLTFGAATTSVTEFERVPSGFWSCTMRLPAVATSDANTGALHAAALVQFVVLAVSPISKVDPGPGLDKAKLPPSTRNVNPLAPPAKTLAGCRDR